MPRTPDALHAWLRAHVQIDVPRTAVMPGHAAPFDYLVHVFFEGRGRFRARAEGAAARAGSTPESAPRERGSPEGPRPTASAAALSAAKGAAGPRRSVEGRGPIDSVVWANRGGGKTFLGAVATMLDLVFKPGIEVRILGGSLDQSKRMHAHLRALFRQRGLAELVEGRMTERRLRLVNGSQVELLAQSGVSVRGTRVQKLRCDEVELFDREVWEAAQLVTRSRRCGETWVRGAVECLSTMHIPHGIMFKIVQEASEGKRRLFKWGVVDVLAACEPVRRCLGAPGPDKQPAGSTDSGADPDSDADSGAPGAPADGQAGAGIRLAVLEPAASRPHGGPEHACALWDDCGGRAKARPGNAEGTGVGHVAIDDAGAMKARVSAAAWEAEMLCLRPSRSAAVLPEFDARVHVVDHLPWSEGGEPALWCGGMDFGLRTAVVLWGAVDAAGVLWIVDEHVGRQALLAENIEAMRAKDWPALRWLGVDPAGCAGNEQTGRSAVDVLRAAGFNVKFARGGIADGLELLRARLKPAWRRPPGSAQSTGPADPLGQADQVDRAGPAGAEAPEPARPAEPRLFVHRCCRELIESLERYHYPADAPGDVNPVKDGADHAVDALRYLVLNLDRKAGALAVGQYQ